MDNDGFNRCLAPKISLSDAIYVAELLYGLETNESLCEEFVGYVDRNFYMKGIFGNSCENGHSASLGEFVFKVLNAVDSEDQGVLDAQTDMMRFLKEKGINCPTSVQSLQGKYIEWVKLPLTMKEDEKQEKKAEPQQTWHRVRLNIYIPGTLFTSIRPSYSLDLFFDVGKFAGKVSYHLQEFHNEELMKRRLLWDPKNVLDILKYKDVLKDKIREDKIASHCIKRLATEFIPLLSNLPTGFIHLDMSDNNLLVGKNNEGEYRVSALLDFGCISYSHKVFEPAIAAAYMMMEYFPNDVIDCSGYILAGYHSVLPLSRTELDLFPLAISSRLISSVIKGLHSFSLDPENKYTLTTQKTGWEVLEILMKTPDTELLKRWKKIYTLKNMEWPVDINNN